MVKLIVEAMNESIKGLLSENRELAKAKEEAEQALQAKSRFLSIMSHEIRTPINAISGLSALLLAHPTDDQEEYLRLLKFSADNLLVIISDILNLSKIEEGKVELEQSDFNLHEVLENIQNINSPLAIEKGIAIRVSYDSKLPDLVKGDAVRMGQIISNLVNNAIKFTSTGEVAIHASYKSADKDNFRILFEVIDTGIGIPTDQQENIFAIFTQASTDTTRKYGGTGLGLAICRQLVSLMGGQLKVKSKPGEGSKFYFTVNLRRCAQYPAKPDQPTPESGRDELAGLKILLAEDNPVNVMVMKRYTGAWNIDCDVAENGEVAVQKTMDGNYDLVLMDVHMPVMDGFEASREIRAMDGNKSGTPIIAVTASLEGDVWASIRGAGIDDYLTKPFKADELYEKLKKYAPGNLFEKVA